MKREKRKEIKDNNKKIKTVKIKMKKKIKKGEDKRVDKI